MQGDQLGGCGTNPVERRCSLNLAGDWAELEAKLDRFDGDTDCRSRDLSGGKEGHQGQCPGLGWGNEVNGDNIHRERVTTWRAGFGKGVGKKEKLLGFDC